MFYGMKDVIEGEGETCVNSSAAREKGKRSGTS